MGDDANDSLATSSELPEEACIPARIVLEDHAFDRLVELIEAPPPPTLALRELMRPSRSVARS